MEKNTGVLKITPAIIVHENYLKSAFDPLFKQLDLFKTKLEITTINDDSHLQIVRDNLVQLAALEKTIANLKAKAKRPIIDAGKQIEAHVSATVNEIESLKSKTKRLVTNYIVVQEAAKAKEEEAKLKASLEVGKTKEEDLNRLKGVASAIEAYIFGGKYSNPKTGKVFEQPIPSSLDDYDTVQSSLAKKFKVNAFEAATDEANALYSLMLQTISSIKVKVIEGKELPAIRNQAYMDYINESRAILNMGEEDLSKQTAKVEKKMNAEITTAGSGLRTIIEYEIEDFETIPEKYKMFNDKEFNSYRAAFRKDILKKLKETNKDGRGIIPGLRIKIKKDISIR